MVYLLVTIEVPRHKVPEAWEFYQKTVQQEDIAHVKQAGGKYIGYWYTEYGRVGEINFMVAYPNLDARYKMGGFWAPTLRETKSEESKKNWAKWFNEYAPHATIKVMRPLPGSPAD